MQIAPDVLPGSYSFKLIAIWPRCVCPSFECNASGYTCYVPNILCYGWDLWLRSSRILEFAESTTGSITSTPCGFSFMMRSWEIPLLCRCLLLGRLGGRRERDSTLCGGWIYNIIDQLHSTSSVLLTYDLFVLCSFLYCFFCTCLVKNIAFCILLPAFLDIICTCLHFLYKQYKS